MGGNENKKFNYIGKMVIDKSGQKKIGNSLIGRPSTIREERVLHK